MANHKINHIKTNKLNAGQHQRIMLQKNNFMTNPFLNKNSNFNLELIRQQLYKNREQRMLDTIAKNQKWYTFKQRREKAILDYYDTKRKMFRNRLLV